MKNCDDRSKTGNRALNFASLFQDKEERELHLLQNYALIFIHKFLVTF
jgi:hypothetical protein